MKKISLFSLLAVLSGLLLVYLGIRHTAIESISRSEKKLRIAKKKVGKHNVTIIRGDPKSVFLDEDLRKAVGRALKVYGSYNVKINLPNYHCFQIYTDVDSEGWYVGIKEMASGNLRCYGSVEVLNNFKIGVRYGVNLVVGENGNCFCGIMEINIESWEKRYDDFGDSVIWLQLRRIEET